MKKKIILTKTKKNNIECEKKDEKIFCQYKQCYVNTHTLIHPILHKVVSKKCDEATTCLEYNCDFKGEN